MAANQVKAMAEATAKKQSGMQAKMNTNSVVEATFPSSMDRARERAKGKGKGKGKGEASTTVAGRRGHGSCQIVVSRVSRTSAVISSPGTLFSNTQEGPDSSPSKTAPTQCSAVWPQATATPVSKKMGSRMTVFPQL